VITARRLDQLEETKVQCGETSRVLVLAGDISDEWFVLELFTQTVSTFGKAVSGETVCIEHHASWIVGRLDLLFNVRSDRNQW